MVVAVGHAGTTRYRMLETLRAYARERSAADDGIARRHAEYFVGLAEAAARGVQGVDERAWIAATMPNMDNFRAAFEYAFAERDADLALRLVAALPELTHVRGMYEADEWAERALDLADRNHPLYAAAVGAAARGAWGVGDYARAVALAARADGLVLGAGAARSGHPADVAADVALYRGDVGRRRGALHGRTRPGPSRAATASGWSGPSTTSRSATPCAAVPGRGVPAARECLEVAQATGNPTALSMGHYALGLVLKKSDPQQALRLLDEAARLAADVQNFWWEGIALMEAAATRAVHADPAVGAAALVAVLDHWDRVGDWSQQWLNLRYVVRLLARLGAERDATVLHHFLVAMGKSSPLKNPGPSESPLSPAEVVVLARESLSRFR